MDMDIDVSYVAIYYIHRPNPIYTYKHYTDWEKRKLYQNMSNVRSEEIVD